METAPTNSYIDGINKFLISIGKPPLQTGPNGFPLPAEQPKQPSAAAGLGAGAASLAAMYAAKKMGLGAGIKSLFASSAATPAAPTLLSASAVPTGTAAAAPVAPSLAPALPYALPALAAIVAAQQGYTGFKEGRGETLGNAIKGQFNSPRSILESAIIPTRPIGAILGSVFGGNRTKSAEQKRWGNLAQSTDAPTSVYANKYLEYLNSPQQKIDAQYPNTFDAKKAAGTLKGEDVWGAPGILENIPGWLSKYSGDQRRDISNQLIAKNLINSSHGDMGLTDVKAANDIASGVLTKALTAPRRK